MMSAVSLIIDNVISNILRASTAEKCDTATFQEGLKHSHSMYMSKTVFLTTFLSNHFLISILG